MSNIAVARFFGHATPDRAGARPYRVQGRVARCSMDRWIVPSREQYRLESKKNSAADHRVKGWSDNYENAHERSKIINAIKETRMVTRLDFRICHLEGGT